MHIYFGGINPVSSMGRSWKAHCVQFLDSTRSRDRFKSTPSHKNTAGSFHILHSSRSTSPPTVQSFRFSYDLIEAPNGTDVSAPTAKLLLILLLKPHHSLLWGCVWMFCLWLLQLCRKYYIKLYPPSTANGYRSPHHESLVMINISYSPWPEI